MALYLSASRRWEGRVGSWPPGVDCIFGFSASGVADSMGSCPSEFVIDMGLNHRWSSMLII